MNKEELFDKYKFLIYKVMKDLNCNPRNEDERQTYYDAGIMGLLKGINGYNQNIKETTTYFYNCIKSGICREFYYETRMIRKINYIENDSLDALYLDKRPVYEVYPDEKVDIENELIKKETYNTLYQAINMLKPTYKDVIYKYYGLNCKIHTLEELAQKHKISRQAMQVKKNNALLKLKENLKKLGVENIE